MELPKDAPMGDKVANVLTRRTYERNPSLGSLLVMGSAFGAGAGAYNLIESVAFPDRGEYNTINSEVDDLKDAIDTLRSSSEELREFGRVELAQDVDAAVTEHETAIEVKEASYPEGYNSGLAENVLTAGAFASGALMFWAGYKAWRMTAQRLHNKYSQEQEVSC